MADAADRTAADRAAYLPPSAAGRWGGRAILRLQKVVDKLLAGRVSQLQGQVIEQDREIATLTHDVGELTAQIVQMNRLLHAIDERLTDLENQKRSTDPE